MTDGHHENLYKWNASQQSKTEHQNEEHNARHHQPLSELLQANLQRCLRLLRHLGHPRDFADLCLQARGNNHRTSAPRREMGAGVNHVFAITQDCLLLQSLAVFQHWQRFACKRSLGGFQ